MLPARTMCKHTTEGHWTSLLQPTIVALASDSTERNKLLSLPPCGEIKRKKKQSSTSLTDHHFHEMSGNIRKSSTAAGIIENDQQLSKF